jgi:7,8-dihydropterin-6-yl-methyl-4-(beta-D-ribofuranosyl)aminobenzene 5'-phosphate synthase
MVNILEHFRSCTGCDRIHAVLGGTHLAPAGAKQFAETVRYLKERGVERIGVSHCTGLPRGAELMREIPGKVFFANVGTSIQFQITTAYPPVAMNT